MTPRIHPLTGEFVDPLEEDAFVVATSDARLWRTRVIVVLSVIGWWAALPRDFGIEPAELRAVCVALRIVGPLPALALVVARTPSPRHLHRHVVVFVTWWFATQIPLNLVHPDMDDKILLVMASLTALNALWGVQRFLALVATNLFLILPMLVSWGVRTQADPQSLVSAGLLASALMMASLFFHVAFNTIVRERQVAVWEMEEQVRARERLTAALAHELRTPMARARMRLALAADEPSQAHTHVEGIRADVAHLSGLVEGMVRLGHLGDGTRTELRESVSPHHLLDTVAETLDGIAPSIRVGVGEVAAGSLRADPELLRSALQSVGTNAVRHARSRVLLEARWVDRALCFDVSDDGPGVAREDRERIFEPFVQAREPGAHGKDSVQLGLGLAIARRIAEAHGGSLTVSDSPLGGARFRICVGAA